MNDPYLRLYDETAEWHSSNGWYCDRCQTACDLPPDDICACCRVRLAEIEAEDGAA